MPFSHLLRTNFTTEAISAPNGPVPDSQRVIGYGPKPVTLDQVSASISSSVSPFSPSSRPPPPPSLPPASTSLPPLNTAFSAAQANAAGNTPTSTNRSHGANQGLYQCADCMRRYSRPEHLARHIQTHTLGRRFCCQVCGKAFARGDLLKRHTANHENDGDETKKRRRTGPALGTGRVSHACRPCAAARVKCDEVKPCTRCRNRNLNCEYASPEAGSAAAMHLMQLSEDAYQSTSPPVAPPGISSVPSPVTYQPQGQLAPPTPTQVMAQNPHYTTNTLVKPGEAQVPTPETAVDQINFDNYSQPYVASGGVGMAYVPFTDFLRDLLYEQPLDPSKQAEGQGLAVLDFCDNTNYELNETDFGLLDHWNLDGTADRPAVAQGATLPTDDSTVDMTQMRQKLVSIWTGSPWRWTPDKHDHAYADQRYLPLPYRDSASQIFQESQKRLDRIIQEKLDASSRDKILSVVLTTCRSDPVRLRVASSFPPADMMDTLAHIFLASHLCSVSGWIHFGSFLLNSQWPEWLAVAAAAGAVLTPVATLRKFGFAIQEAVRMAIPLKFEENNTGIQILGLVQTLVLCQDIGLWSGNKRKMEIAECHLLIPITMMRYRGRFQRSPYTLTWVEESDEGDALEEKWKRWHEMESWKRLAFHCYLRDAQTSMTTLSIPIMSYAELTLPLPEAKELWFAKSAAEWKKQFLLRAAGQSKHLPCLGDLIRDASFCNANHGRLDVQYTISIYLHAFWSLIFEWRQLSTVHRLNTFQMNCEQGPNLILMSRHQELIRTLSSFQLVTADWHSVLSVQETLLLNLLLMNLHVSLDDLQLFAGKQGEDQARRVYPTLQQWAESTEARKALWHAGQIVRQAKMFPPGHLKDFFAVGLHHAALALWTYGVVTRATRNTATSNLSQEETVHLDGIDSPQVQRFIGLGQGRPTLRGPRGESGAEGVESTLQDPKTCMDVVQNVLRMNFSDGKELLPQIVENLSHLINQLGGAAWAVGLS